MAKQVYLHSELCDSTAWYRMSLLIIVYCPNINQNMYLQPLYCFQQMSTSLSIPITNFNQNV